MEQFSVPTKNWWGLLSPHVPIPSGTPEICAKYTGSMKDMKYVYFYEFLNAYYRVKSKMMIRYPASQKNVMMFSQF